MAKNIIIIILILLLGGAAYYFDPFGNIPDITGIERMEKKVDSVYIRDEHVEQLVVDQIARINALQIDSARNVKERRQMKRTISKLTAERNAINLDNAEAPELDSMVLAIYRDPVGPPYCMPLEAAQNALQSAAQEPYNEAIIETLANRNDSLEARIDWQYTEFSKVVAVSDSKYVDERKNRIYFETLSDKQKKELKKSARKKKWGWVEKLLYFFGGYGAGKL